MAITSIAAVVATLAPIASGGADWVALEIPAGDGALAPRIGVVGERAVLSWLEPTGEGRAFVLRGASLGADGVQPFAAPAVVGADLFVNWADTPGIVPSPGGALVAHWLEMLGDGTYAYGIELARSTDGGATWERLGRLHTDDQPVEHGFASFAAGPTGLTAVWLDGRETGGGHGDGEGHGAGDGHGGGRGAMTLRTAHVGEGVRQELLLDADVCDCCPTAVVTTATGPLVAYRDRVPGDELRDIGVVRWLGDRWSDPTLIHADGWAVAGCPVNGPVLAADGERVAAAWFTMSPSTRVNFTLSTDGGATFAPAQPLYSSGDGIDVHGRPALAFDQAGRLHAVHLVERGREGALVHQVLGADGAWSAPATIVPTSAGRRSGVPVLARVGEDLMLATTAVGEDGGTRVELRRLARD